MEPFGKCSDPIDGLFGLVNNAMLVNVVASHCSILFALVLVLVFTSCSNSQANKMMQDS